MMLTRYEAVVDDRDLYQVPRLVEKVIARLLRDSGANSVRSARVVRTRDGRFYATRVSVSFDSAFWTGRSPMPWYGRRWGWRLANAFYEPDGGVLIIQLGRLNVAFIRGRFYEWRVT